MKIHAKIVKKTEKAVKLQFKEGREFWIPRSVIAKRPKPDYDFDDFQKFLIKTKFLKKKIRNDSK